MRLTRRNAGVIVLLLLPGLLLYAALVLYPVVDSLILSFYKWPTFGVKQFAGFYNYNLVFHDSIFWKSVKNTLIFMVGTTVFQIAIGFIFGYLVYLQLRGHKVFKTVFFIPCVLSSVAVGFIWSYIYSPDFGILLPVMKAVGLSKYYVPPLSSPSLALMFTILAYIWQNVGVQIMMFNSGFMAMPQEVLECASLDGATGFRKIIYMVLPLSWDIVKVIIVLQVIGSLRAFDLVYIMTTGGPNHATEVLTMNMFSQAFTQFNLGYGSVDSVVIFVLALGLTLGLRKIMYRESIN